MDSVSEKTTVRATLRGSSEATALVVDAEIACDEVHLSLPAGIAQQLQLTERDRRVTTSGLSVPYVGPVELTVGELTICGGAVVCGTTVQLGMVPLADLESDAL